MPRTLYARLALVLILIFLGIGILYSVITTSTTQQYFQQVTQHFNRDLAKRIVADRNLVAEGRINKNALKDAFSAYMDINPSIEIYLLDMQGEILSFSADPGKVKRQRVDLAPIHSFLAGDGFPLLGDDPRSHDRRKAFSVTPVPSGDAPEGYLYVVLQGEQYDSVEQAVTDSYIFKLSAWTVTGSLLFGLLAGLVLFHILTRRLQRLSSNINSFQAGDFQSHSPYAADHNYGEDEIEQLGAVFDRMADRITSQLEQLKNQDRLRRELVAQVSHDLRTPLAALHGYLETVQIKRDELSQSEQEKCLKIALDQSTRLKLMVEDLFELAHLEARDIGAQLEPCSIAELLNDIVQKFQLGASRAEITLLMSPPASPLPMALADIQLTERVLDNLITNALSHIPSGCTISLGVELDSDQQGITISVSDNGPGITEQDLPHIFEPFYRSQKSENAKGMKHGGLGLAIAQRISKLQGSELTVKNISTGGASFQFKLPLASMEKPHANTEEHGSC